MTLVPQRKTEPLAILSLVFSGIAICGFCCGLFIVAAIAGVVCGHLALSKIKANPELEGHGLAMSGIIIGYVAIGLVLIRVLFFGGLAALARSAMPCRSREAVAPRLLFCAVAQKTWGIRLTRSRENQ